MWPVLQGDDEKGINVAVFYVIRDLIIHGHNVFK
jgi:hypothetical protein